MRLCLAEKVLDRVSVIESCGGQKGEVVCMAGELVAFNWWTVVFQMSNLVLIGMIMFLVFYYFRKSLKDFVREIKEKRR